MPFKEACIEYLDELAPSAKAILSVNTIVIPTATCRASTPITQLFRR